MYRLYYCPNCRATIYYRDRFCGNCGVSLKWVETPISPVNSNIPDRKSSGDQQNGYLRQQDHRHKEQQKKSIQDLHKYRTQKPISGSAKIQLKENTNISLTAVKDKRKPAEDNTELLKSEITKLLESLHDKAG